MYIKVSGVYDLQIPQNNENYAMEYIILSCDTSLGPVTINLKPISAFSGFQNERIMVIDSTGQAAANNITVNAGAANFINDVASIIINTNFGSSLLSVADEDTWQALNPSAGAIPAGMALHPVTYAQLIALIGGTALIQGDFYLLTDFATKYIIPNTIQVNTGVVEPLILQAATIDSLYENAISTLFPKDQITYEVEDSTTAGGDKGRISFRRDTLNNNSTYYDWRNVQFRRWETAPASGQFYIITDNGEAFNDYYTFNNSATASLCFNNIIGPIGKSNPQMIPITNKLNNTVFNCRMQNNTFDSNCINNTIIGQTFPGFPASCSENNVGSAFIGNTIGFPLVIGSPVMFKNTIQYAFVENNIRSFSFNELGYDFSYNTIGLSFSSNSTNQSFTSNIIGDRCERNNFGNYFANNPIIGDDFKDNLIGINFGSNTIGNLFQNNITGNNFTGNASIGNNFIGNQIGDNFANNIIIGDDFFNNIIGDSFQANVSIGNSFQRNHILSNFSANSIDTDFTDNQISNSFTSNTIGAFSNFNIIGNLFNGNVIGGGFINNQIGTSFILNIAVANFQNNKICNNFTPAGVDFTLATFVYAAYDKEIFQNSVGVFRLKYTNNLDVILYVAPAA
jgi:hypothetical protein